MAFQHDYLLRIIELMGDFFRRLGDLVDEKEKLIKLDAACRDRCGLPLNKAAELSQETLKSLLTPQARFILSELMYIKARCLVQQPEKVMEADLCALRLMLNMHEDVALCLERAQRVRELMDACEAELCATDYLLAAQLFFTAERFSDMEDMLFFAAEFLPDRNVTILRAIALLKNARVLPEDVLLAGGMGYEDIDRAVVDMENKLY